MLHALLDRWAERVVFTALEQLRHGRLVVATPAGVESFGDGHPSATLRIHHPRFFRRVVAGGEVGLGDSYMDGDWSTPNLVALIRLMLQNGEMIGALPAFAGWVSRLREVARHRRRRNTRDGSRRNVSAHYDLGNEFFECFLDDDLLYSCAVYERPDDTLDVAQQQKLRRIGDKLALQPGDRVLEIGSGWGGFARFATRHYGCKVTTTTISARQHDYVARMIATEPDLADAVELRFEDYRDLRGSFDKIVSIEMFEAVGLEHYDEFFGACDRLLAPDGVMLLQTITVDDWRFADYRREPSWIAKRIFPGGELASMAEMLGSIARVTRLGLFHAEQIGTHYARTLRQWRERFHRRLDDVRGQGFDERFIRMWDLYLGYCEAAFLERHIGTVQLLLAKSANRRLLFGEPWQRLPASSVAEPAAVTRAERP